MYLKLMPVMEEFTGAYEGHGGDFDHIKLAFQLSFPKLQEFVQDRKAWGNVQILPDIGLQQGWMVGYMVDYFRRGQAVIL